MISKEDYGKNKDSDIFEAREILDVAIGHGVRHAVLSPGSRNAPLLIAASAREELKKYGVADERTAAFIALGLSTSAGTPVALVCTSGTALLNYAPAVAEAFYRQIPLIVISADRPEEWIDQDDSQTIRQYEALRNFVKESYDLEAGEKPERTGLVNRFMNDAMTTALTPPYGPVHINIRFPEPLGRVRQRQVAEPRIITSVSVPSSIPRTVVKDLCKGLGSKKIMVTVGFLTPDHKMRRALKELEELPNVCIMAETLANYNGTEYSSVVDVVLGPLSIEKKKGLKPELVISAGGALVSRKLKEFLRSSHAEHWGVGHFRTTVDCFRSLTHRIEADPAPFLRTLASVLREYTGKDCPDYRDQWKREREKACKRRDILVESSPWCELKAFSILSRQLTPDMNLHLSNGTSVRYGQLFDFDVHATYCNRGVSGIDGSTSTAIGNALAYSGTSVLITGDMSFSYDVGALMSRLAPERMKIIVINNHGGAIFRFVGSTSAIEENVRETFFCADPKPPIRELADAFGWNYISASSEDDLERILPLFLGNRHRSILEIIVPEETGARELTRLLSPDPA